jgi:hypothetical protein
MRGSHSGSDSRADTEAVNKARRLAGLAMVLAVAAGSCTSSSQKTVLLSAPAKPYPCDLELFTSAEEVKKPFEKLCVIDAKGASRFDDRSDAAGRALERARQDACACGADALIIQDSYRDRDNAVRIKFKERQDANVYGVAIRYSGGS